MVNMNHGTAVSKNNRIAWFDIVCSRVKINSLNKKSKLQRLNDIDNKHYDKS